jgi:hypothetical protein
MKHSAKAAAKLARQRKKQARRDATAAASRTAATAAAVGAGAAARAATASTPARSVAGGRPHTMTPRLAQLPYALVLAGLVAGLALMQGGSQAVKSGTLVIAGAVLAGSLTRLVLPAGRAGLLRSRRRLVDVALLTVLGAGLLIAGLIVQVPG